MAAVLKTDEEGSTPAETPEGSISENGNAGVWDISNEGDSSQHSASQPGDGHLMMTGNREKLGVVPLAVIIFYGVSGGPFGVEETVRSAGNFYTLLGFSIFPFVWSVQEALMTAELGSAFPEASGGVAWVTEAFGHTWGWMNGYVNWVSGATDNAIYPVLFVDYLLALMGKGDDQNSIGPVFKFCLFTVMSCTLAYTNWLGLNLVGKMSITICILAISPFLLLSVVGVSQVESSRWFLPPETEADSDAGSDKAGLFSLSALTAIAWRPYLNNLFWNLNSFDNASAFAADIDDPGRVLPRALFWSVIMISACYLVPLVVALGASSAKQADWVDGYFSIVAEDIAGPWLGGWLVFASAISNIAMFQAELSSDAFQLMGMAERGYLPKIFATRSRHGTPTYGILVGTFVVICMTVTNLDDLIEMLNFNYAVALLLEYAAFIKLRISRPNMERPYRVPLSTIGCILLFAPTVVAVVVVMLLASFKTWAFSVFVCLVGWAIFWCKERQSDYSSMTDGVFRDDSEEDDNDDQEHHHHHELPGSMKVATQGGKEDEQHGRII